MAAQNETKTVKPGVWLLVSDGPIAAISMQNKGSGALYFIALPQAAQPAAGTSGAMELAPGEAVASLDLAAAFLGVSGPDAVWIYSPVWPGEVWVSHG